MSHWPPSSSDAAARSIDSVASPPPPPPPSALPPPSADKALAFSRESSALVLDDGFGVKAPPWPTEAVVPAATAMLPESGSIAPESATQTIVVPIVVDASAPPPSLAAARVGRPPVDQTVARPRARPRRVALGEMLISSLAATAAFVTPTCRVALRLPECINARAGPAVCCASETPSDPTLAFAPVVKVIGPVVTGRCRDQGKNGSECHGRAGRDIVYGCGT